MEDEEEEEDWGGLVRVNEAQRAWRLVGLNDCLREEREHGSTFERE